MGRKPTGSVFEKPAGSGRYAFAFLLRSGKRYVRSVPATGPTGAPITRADAVVLKNEAMRRYELGLWDPEAPVAPEAPRPVLTVAAYGVPWAAGLTHSSADTERRVMEQYIVPSELGPLPLDQVTPPKVAAWVAWLSRQPSTMGGLLAPGTVRVYAAVLKRMFTRACFEERCPTNPCILPRGILPAVRDKVPGARRLWPFSREEVERLISDPAVPLVRRVIYALLFLSGARCSEMTVLCWSDYDPARAPLGCLTLERGLRRTRKSRTARTEWIEGPTKTRVVKELPVHPTLAAVLAEWKLSGWERSFGRAPRPDDRIVPTEKFTPRKTSNVRQQLHNDCVALEMRRRRTHGTRHTFITLALKDGADEALLRKLTHPLPEGTEHDSFQRYRHEDWARLCAEVAKLRITRRAEVLPLWKAAVGDGTTAGSPDIATDIATGSTMTDETRGNSSPADASCASTPEGHRPENPVADRDTFLAPMAFTREIELALTAARAAADRVRALYESGVEVAWKGHDDPVTTADREANAMIVAALREAFPGDGICAEESDAGESSQAAARGGRCWFIDPLDGTKDFVQRNGEFCVMVGLAVQGRAALGVVVSPVSGVALVGVPGEGAWSVDPSGARSPLAVRPVTSVTAARMIGSRSHPHPRVTALAAALGVTDLRVRGSVGLKVAAVATGECDLYAHFGRGPKLWDGCAPEAIARGAGARVTDSLGRDIAYDTAHLGLDDGLVVAPPWLHAVALAELARLAARA